MYQRPTQETNVASTIGLLIMGIAICTAWLWVANPDVLRSILAGLGSGHWLVLLGLIVGGLIGLAFLRQLFVAFLQFVGVLVRLAMFVGLVAGGLFLWRSLRPIPASPASSRPLSEAWATPAPAIVVPELSPEERRAELEAELRRLDRQTGNAWWQAK